MAFRSTGNIQQLAMQARSLLDIGDIHRAGMVCDEAVNQGATAPDMLLQIGKVRYFRKRYDEAADFFRQVLDLRPQDSEARIMLWASYRDGGDFDAMLDLARQFQSHPLNANEVFMAYRSFLSACDWSNAEKIQDKIFTLVKQGEIRHDLIPALLIELCGIPGLAPKLVFDLHRQWGINECKGKQQYFPAGLAVIRTGERLKVAYLSADFKLHPVGFFMNRVIASHDRQHFDIYCYAHIGRDDALTRNIRKHADHFIDITALPNDEVATRIHADGIHILIDLGGHTTDTRLPVLAYRPAPVQMTYLGYPNTSGLPAVDFHITDRHAECEEGTRYVEKLLYMPQSFLCYGVDPSGLRTGGTPVEEKDHITFASFNHVRKMTPHVIQAWSRILKRVPDSRLALKARGLDNIVVRDNMLREFAGHGIQAERIEFRPYTKTYEQHIVQYNGIDIALDTFPYNGTTTTCDALAMGVPVVTFTGKAHAQRVSCSILKNIGFEETITDSMDAYVDTAVGLAGKPANLTMLRKILPTLFRHSILCQPEKFTRQLESLYHQAWQERIIAQHHGHEKYADDLSKNPDGEPSHPEWIFIVGMVRSGSTWCYNVIRQLLKKSKTGTVLGFVGECEAVDKVLLIPNNDPSPKLLKFHTPTKLSLQLLQEGKAKGIYSQRDLRDVAASLMDFEKFSLSHFIHQRLPSILLTHGIWRGAPNIQHIEYRNIIKHPEVSIRQLVDGLGIHHDAKTIRKIAKECSSSAARKQMKSMRKAKPSSKSMRQAAPGRFYDSDSLLHANHISSGEIGRYKEYFKLPQIDELNAHLSSWLIKEGYDFSSENNSSPTGKEIEQITFNPAAQSEGNQAGKGTKTVRIKNDVLVVVPDDLNLMTPYVLEEQQDWFEDEIKFIRKLIKPDMRIIDIGANYGCYTLTMAKLTGVGGKLWAFEPASSTAGFLQQSIEANGFDQIQLIRAALSSQQGEAELSIRDNAELNSLTQSSDGNERMETVPVCCLDDCMQIYGWEDIDFLKLDAEGEEIRILQGGEKFFRTLSPLVMFELKHAEKINEGLIQSFRDMDYEPYKFIPGLMMLAPFDRQEEPDPFQLNLFCCKQDRARQLQEAGMLSMDEDESETILPGQIAWIEYLKTCPYAAPLLSQWSSSDAGLPGGETYITALNACAVAHAIKGSPESYRWLKAAFIQLISALEEHASLPRLLTLARIATDMGRRSAAVQALNQFVETLNREKQFNPIEPFLAASEHAANIDPARELANWCLVQALAERERLQTFSSYFTGSSSLPVLNIIENSNYHDAEMKRRRELINRRYAY